MLRGVGFLGKGRGNENKCCTKMKTRCEWGQVRRRGKCRLEGFILAILRSVLGCDRKYGQNEWKNHSLSLYISMKDGLFLQKGVFFEFFWDGFCETQGVDRWKKIVRCAQKGRTSFQQLPIFFENLPSLWRAVAQRAVRKPCFCARWRGDFVKSFRHEVWKLEGFWGRRAGRGRRWLSGGVICLFGRSFFVWNVQRWAL